MASTQVFYAGNVQGVGFRYTVKHIAKGFDVTGSVRNLADGRVELRASGAPPELAAFIEAISQSELRAHIKEQTEAPFAGEMNTRGFEILHD